METVGNVECGAILFLERWGSRLHWELSGVGHARLVNPKP